MTRRSKLWLAAATIFTAINSFGGMLAAAQMEMMHVLVHAVLTVVGTVIMWRILARGGAAQPVATALPAGPVNQLQQSLDALAVEVERIGEAQRYLARIAAERGKSALPNTRR